MASSVPSKLIFLADLPRAQPGDKVRFLGCVDFFDVTEGTLIVRHDYSSSKHAATVTIEHVREGLPTDATVMGTWLNIVGYVQSHTDSATIVQATMLWEAGPVKLIDYERALQARKDSSTTTR